MKIRLSIAIAVATMMAVIGLSEVAATAAPTGTPYPPGGNCATVSIDKTTGHPGDLFTVTGINFAPGDHLQLELEPLNVVVATPTASSTGSFVTTFRMPANASGSQQLFVVGNSTVCLPDPIQIQLSGTGATSTGHGGLAMTGTEIAALLFGALAVLGAGILLAAAGRRRSTARHGWYDY